MDKYCTKDGTMYVAMDDSFPNRPCQVPEDGHYGWGKPASEWILSKDGYLHDEHSSYGVETKVYAVERYHKMMEEKIRRYRLAIELYKSAGGNIDDLPSEPVVIENYTPSKDSYGSIDRYFIFKESNNGTSYRIVDSYDITREIDALM